MNVKLQTSKFSKGCTLSTKIKWFSTRMKSKLLWPSLENDQLNHQWLWYTFHKTTIFFMCSHFKPYQRLATFLSRSKRLETRSLVSKFGKPPKPLKTKFVVKSTLKNQNRYRAQSCEMYSKTLSFWSKG
jgi:hypothetical protein